MLPATTSQTGSHEVIAVEALPAHTVFMARVAAGSVIGLIVNLLWMAT